MRTVIDIKPISKSIDLTFNDLRNGKMFIFKETGILCLKVAHDRYIVFRDNTISCFDTTSDKDSPVVEWEGQITITHVNS